MVRLAWLTPDDDSEGVSCFRVSIPAGIEYEAAFRGAFLLLCDPANWQDYGSKTADEVAALFTEAFFATQDGWRGCVSGHFIGEIIWFTGTSAPAGTLPCDGSFYDPDTYPDLFSVVQYRFGDDGNDNFAVPDLRGRVPIGRSYEVVAPDWIIGNTYGNNFINIEVEDLPAHHHGLKRPGARSGSNPGLEWIVTADFTTEPNIYGSTRDTGGDRPFNNMQDSLCLMPVIVYQV